MQKKHLFGAIGLISIGILFGVVLVTNLQTIAVSKLFAADVKLGSDKPPIVSDQSVKMLNNAFVAASKAVSPTVVSITVKSERKGRIQSQQDMSPFEDMFPFFEFKSPNQDKNGGSLPPAESSGSGVFVTSDGYIVTNNHVVENAKEITVTTSNAKEYKAKLIGTDPLTDLALIKIEGTSFPTAHFAKAEQVQVGEWVIAVGNPLGLRSTVTQGIVSAIGRGQLNLSNNNYAVENFIQTDAAINPGNSGGGLFNLEGSLVGINTAIATRTGGYMGYGFAIPVDIVQSVVMDLIEDGKIDRGYIGVSIRTVDETTSKAVNLDKVQGVFVESIIKGSPAEKAGIEQGDIILELDGTPINSSNELQGKIVLRRAGETIKIKLFRDGKIIEKSVKLLPRDGSDIVKGESSSPSKNDEEKNEPVSFDKLGFTVMPLDEKAKENLDVSNGAFISSVKQAGPAARKGITTNGVIVSVSGQPVKSVADLKKILESKKPGEAVLLKIKYKDSMRAIPLGIPDSNS